MRTYRDASVHGRFQPFHNGHAEYVTAAVARCDFLWVGITQVEVTRLQSDPLQPAHRYDPEENPLTYWERVRIVQAALTDIVDPRQFVIVPFPIERPEMLHNYVPEHALAFTTIYDKWNRTKIQLLEDSGYSVEVLWERTEKAVAGSEVRHRMRVGDNSWRELVPPAAARALDGLHIPDRLYSGPAR